MQWGNDHGPKPYRPPQDRRIMIESVVVVCIVLPIVVMLVLYFGR